MTIYTHVEGGTGAGTRRAPYTIPKDDWNCTCGSLNRYYWKNCPSCYTDRPKPQ